MVEFEFSQRSGGMGRLKKRVALIAFAALTVSALASATTLEGWMWRLTSLPGYDLAALVHEQSISTNTAAAGGNAQLMTMA